MSLEGFAELRAQMEAFQGRVHGHLGQQRHAMEQLLAAHRQEVEKLRLRTGAVQQQLARLAGEEQELRQNISSLQERTQHTTAQRDAYAAQRQKLAAERTQLEHDRAELHAMLARKQAELQRQREAIKRQHMRDNPEVRVYEQLLGLYVRASRPDSLEFAFRNVSEADARAECSFTLDLGADGYRVAAAQPPLPLERLRDLERDLGSSGDLPAFLKAIRAALVTAMAGQADA